MKTYLRAVVFLATLLLSALVATPALATISAAPRAAMMPACSTDGPCDPGPPCYSTSCAGLAPDGLCESNVSNLFKDDSTPIRAILEIRHSGYCNSNWARLRFLETSDCKMTGVAIQRRSYSNGSWHLGGIQSATRGLQILQACPDTELSGETEDMDVTVPRDVHGRVRRSLEVTIKEIAKRAPNAQIVLMGYPKLMEGSGGCVPGIGTAEAPWMNEMGQEMSDMMTNLVGTSTYGLRAAGYKVWYADPIDEFAGEAICGDPETIHGIVTGKTESDEPSLIKPSNESFHPKIPGTSHYRDALQETLRQPGLGLGN